MDHEYAVLGGLNRANVGKWVMWVSVTLSAAVSALAGLIVALVAKSGVAVPPVLLWPLTAGTIYLFLYARFNDRVWKIPRLARWLRVPDLSGTWICRGQSLHAADGRPALAWQGEIEIVQSWDKIQIRLRTGQSASKSISAALVYESTDGYRVLYNYRNEPRIDESDLKAHRGYAELLFRPDLTSAIGEYFNGHGRYTYGTLNLTRKEKSAP